MYITIYLKLAKRTECSFTWCKNLHRHMKLYIVDEIGNSLPENVYSKLKRYATAYLAYS